MCWVDPRGHHHYRGPDGVYLVTIDSFLDGFTGGSSCVYAADSGVLVASYGYSDSTGQSDLCCAPASTHWFGSRIDGLQSTRTLCPGPPPTRP